MQTKTWTAVIYVTCREDGHTECDDMRDGFKTKFDASAWAHAQAAHGELTAPHCDFRVAVAEDM